MQLRNKQVNYYLQRDKLMLLYDVNYNSMYHPYRVVFYNKQLLMADDWNINVDMPPFTATSPSILMKYPNLCPSNMTFDWEALSCISYFFLPLSAKQANLVKLPLERTGPNAVSN